MIQRHFGRPVACSTPFYSSCLICLLCFAVIGCSRSEPNEPSTVEPPTPTEGALTNGASNDSELSGGLQLPAGEIPAPDSESTDDHSGGIEMPDEANANPGASTDSLGTPVQILYADFDEIETSAKSSGKVTVVDLWSLSCAPCLKEFPGLVRLHNEHGESVLCIAVDMDYDGRRSRPPEKYADRVTAFLDKMKATDFPTYISNTPSDDVFAKLDIGSLPAVLVFNAEGDLEKIFADSGETAGFTYEKDIEPMVLALAGN